jgi:pimeloyl-ACP methyl ester carboxylesterase
MLASLAGCGSGPAVDRTTTEGKTVSFRTEDGLTLSGTAFGAGHTGVVLAHMYPADQTSWFSFAERLARQGYRALTFDFRGYGQSQGEKDIASIDRDVAAAVAEIERLGAESVVLAGASMGGTASLIAAAGQPVWAAPAKGAGVAGVVTLSAPSAFRGLDARPVLGDVRVPVLLLAAEGDRSAVPDAQSMAAALGGSADVVELPGDRHGTDLLSGPESEQVATRILTFLEGLGPASGGVER